MESESITHGVSDFWKHVSHIAIVVKDVGRSLVFYTDVIGMTQVMRPDFDRYRLNATRISIKFLMGTLDLRRTSFLQICFRHGAWLSMGNVDLHLIKGRPAVHGDNDLIVSHIAINIDQDKMQDLRERLTNMGVRFRINISVPDPATDKGTGASPVDQVYLYHCHYLVV